MALARIISRSQQCWRELAVDLLARGYSVEVVSPDAIPDNLADLELRVEADAADKSTATVEARGGDQAASLDFVHHLKTPMGDFVRRRETSQAIDFPAQPVTFNAEQRIAEAVELPSENWRAPEPARPKLEISPASEGSARLIMPPEHLLPSAKEPKHARRWVTITIHRSENWCAPEPARPKLGISPASEGSARLIMPPEHLLPSAKEPKHARRWVTITIHRSEPKQARIARSGGWFGRAVVTFAVMVVVVLVLGRAIRWGGLVSVNQDSQNGPAKTATVPDANWLTNPEPVHAAPAVTVPTAAGKSAVKPDPISKEPVTPRVAATFGKSKAVRSHTKVDGLVARDTVTYFDRPASVAPVMDSSRRRASSHKQGGGIAQGVAHHKR